MVIVIEIIRNKFIFKICCFLLSTRLPTGLERYLSSKTVTFFRGHDVKVHQHLGFSLHQGGVVMSSQIKHTHSHQDTPLSPYT